MIDKLEMFIALARERHFGRAAESLGITQPSLSAGIKQLESQLGVQLVHRGSRFGGLTPEGQRVLDWARQIVGDVRTMKQEMRAAHVGLSGNIRLAVIPTALPLVSSLTEAFNRTHPDVRFTIYSQSSVAILEAMEGLQIDGGITYLDNEPLGRMTSVPLYHEDYALVCHRESAEAAAAQVDWPDLGSVNLCLLTPDMQNRRIINQTLASYGATPVPTVESNSTVVLVAHVETGKWATILPRQMAGFLIEGRPLVMRPLAPSSRENRVGLISPDRDPQTPVMAALIETARKLGRT